IALYVYGLTFIVGTGSGNNPGIAIASSVSGYLQFENCKFKLASTGVSSGVIRTGITVGTQMIWRNCEVKFAAAGQSITCVDGFWHWNGGGITAGGTSPTNLIG